MSVHFNEDEAQRLANQIGEMFSGLYDQLRTRKVPKLGESFDIVKFDLDDLSPALAQHKLIIKPTQFQHHQIWIGKRAKAYAISEVLPEGKRRIIETSISLVAERMHEAIARLDRDMTDEAWTAQLLVVPAIKTYAFFLANRLQEQTQKLYLFSVPERFDLHFPGYIDPASDFLNLLDSMLTSFAPFIGKEKSAYW